MPVFNASETLVKSIDSILSQTYSNWELVAVNDGSEDNSGELLQKIAQQDQRIIVINQENAGPGVARNNGINYATGDYIAFLDSDDYWEDNFLELIYQKIESNDTDIVFYDLVREIGKKKKYSVLSNYQYRTKDDIVRLQMTGLFEWGMVKVIRTSLIKDNNLHFSEYKVGEECIFSFDVLRNASTIAFVDKPLYHYVDNTNGQHKKGNEDPWWSTVVGMKNHLNQTGLYEKYETALNSLACRALAICLFRIFKNNSFKQAKSSATDHYQTYFKNYDLNNIDSKLLGSQSRVILFLFQKKFCWILNVLAKIR